jgi:hypothetical protein
VKFIFKLREVEAKKKLDLIIVNPGGKTGRNFGMRGSVLVDGDKGLLGGDRGKPLLEGLFPEKKFDNATADNFFRSYKMLNMDRLLYYYENEEDNDMKYLMLQLLERIQLEYNDFELNPSSGGNDKLP